MNQFFNSVKIWQLVSLIEFLCLLFILFKKQSKRKLKSEFENEILKEAKDSNVNMDNLMDSIYKSKALYDVLIRKCHPDRFTDPDLNFIATDLTKSIQENSTNYSKLIELKIIAQKKLLIEIA
jgi:hypothetical protein